jgi:hypothetical protein
VRHANERLAGHVHGGHESSRGASSARPRNVSLGEKAVEWINVEPTPVLFHARPMQVHEATVLALKAWAARRCAGVIWYSLA